MMKTNPFAVALKAKGPLDVYRRFRSITKRYGLNSGLMDLALQRFSELLQKFDCGATFPITTVTLKRHKDIIKKYLNQNIEFAVHGFTHVDYSRLSHETQLDHLQRAWEEFEEFGITPKGFRSPYLSRNDSLEKAILEAGFSYVSNQPILWDVLESNELTSSVIDGYNRALLFYNPWRADERLSLPRLRNHLLEIPVSLPDDEILIERLVGDNSLIHKTWQRILTQTYQRGELFTLQLHPERTFLCVDSLEAVLTEARALSPAVWCARLDEIAAWWKARAFSTIEISETDKGVYECIVNGPLEMTLLAREIEIGSANSPWANNYREVKATQFTFKSSLRPSIGLSPSTSIDLANFLQQQGYIVEISSYTEKFSNYFDQIDFDSNQERIIIDQIERSNCPLIKIGRWPNGAQSALAITGDIDAMTLWDYGLRMLGN